MMDFMKEGFEGMYFQMEILEERQEKVLSELAAHRKLMEYQNQVMSEIVLAGEYEFMKNREYRKRTGKALSKLG